MSRLYAVKNNYHWIKSNCKSNKLSTFAPQNTKYPIIKNSKQWKKTVH